VDGRVISGGPWRVVVCLAALLALGACTADNGKGAGPVAQGAPATAAPAPLDRTPLAEAPRPVPPAGVPVGARVALLVPLTGPQAALGRDLLDAAQLAIFDLAGPDFTLVPHDTGASTAGAEQAARAALTHRAAPVRGPFFSDSAQAVAPLLRGAGVPAVAFTNDASVSGNGVWAMGFRPSPQIERAVRHAAAQGAQRFAMLVPDTAYGRLVASAAEQAVAAAGGQLVAAETYTPGDRAGTDATVRRLARYDARHRALLAQRAELAQRNDDIAREALRRLDKLDTLGDPGFDAIVLAAGGQEVLGLAPLLAFYDIDPGQVRLIGTWLWEDRALGTEPAMLGARFAAPSPEARGAFRARFEQAYGRAPARLATLAYDAVALAAVLAAEAQQTEGAPAGASPYTLPALTDANGFAGIDGIFRLLPDGQVERGLAILEVRRDGPVVVDPAPATFQALSN